MYSWENVDYIPINCTSYEFLFVYRVKQLKEGVCYEFNELLKKGNFLKATMIYDFHNK